MKAIDSIEFKVRAGRCPWCRIVCIERPGQPATEYIYCQHLADSDPEYTRDKKSFDAPCTLNDWRGCYLNVAWAYTEFLNHRAIQGLYDNTHSAAARKD